MTTEAIAQSIPENPTTITRRRSVTGRADVDILLLGGLSIFALSLMYLFQPIDASWSVSRHFSSISWTFLNLSVICNYPHFMASYRMAYGQGKKFILRYWVQLVLVPIILIGVFSTILLAICDTGFRDFLSPILQNKLGLISEPLSAPILKDIFSNLFINAMFLTVGWHYGKQVYGVMLCQARFAEYPLTSFQKKICWAVCTSIWVMNFVFANSSPDRHRSYYDASYLTFSVPEIFSYVSLLFFSLAFSGVIVFILLRNYRLHKKTPSIRFITPLLAFTAWWFPLIPRNDYYFHMVPFFHSLQYLVFVHAFELMRSEEHSRTEIQSARKYWMIVAAYIATGLIFFEMLPNFIDVKTNMFGIAGFGIFFLFFTTFINVHHYFIDNTLWRRDGMLLKDYIMRR